MDLHGSVCHPETCGLNSKAKAGGRQPFLAEFTNQKLSSPKISRSLDFTKDSNKESGVFSMKTEFQFISWILLQIKLNLYKVQINFLLSTLNNMCAVGVASTSAATGLPQVKFKLKGLQLAFIYNMYVTVEIQQLHLQNLKADVTDSLRSSFGN